MSKVGESLRMGSQGAGEGINKEILDEHLPRFRVSKSRNDRSEELKQQRPFRNVQKMKNGKKSRRLSMVCTLVKLFESVAVVWA
jgi:hypothetical protein